jgi:hypothetical protein
LGHVPFPDQIGRFEISRASVVKQFCIDKQRMGDWHGLLSLDKMLSEHSEQCDLAFRIGNESQFFLNP